MGWKEKILDYCKEPHVSSEIVEHFGNPYLHSTINRLFNEKKLVRSSPVKVESAHEKPKLMTSAYWLNAEALKDTSGTVYVPQVKKQLKFYYNDAWVKLFKLLKRELKYDDLLEYLERVKAATAYEIAEELNVKVRKVTAALHELVKQGRIVRRGKKTKFGTESIIPRLGYVYGIDYEAITKKLEEVLRSQRAAPVLARALRRIDADSRQGELTAETLLRHELGLFPSQLSTVAKYCEEHKDYEVSRWGISQWFYNKTLILEKLTEEQLEEKVKAIIESAKGIFNVKLLSGIAFEIAISKALKLCKEFQHIEFNKYVPYRNPYGREIDFVAASEVITEKAPEKQVYAGEIKLTRVSKEAIMRFYDKIRYTQFVTFSNTSLTISNEIDVMLSRKVVIPVRAIKSNVTLIFIASDFTKEAIEECKLRGVIWIYADSLLDRLTQKLRRRVYGKRIMRIVEEWVNEERAKGTTFISRREIRKRLKDLLHEKLGL